MVLSFSELTEQQRKLTRMLRLPVPPQLPLLADQLIEFFKENEDASNELGASDAKSDSFPAMKKYWIRYRTAIERYVDGVRAPLRAAIRSVTGKETVDQAETSRAVAHVLREAGQQFGDDSPILKSSKELEDSKGNIDTLEAVASAVSGKPRESLTEEDFGKAVGVLEVASELSSAEARRRELGEFELIHPGGTRRRYARVENEEALSWIAMQLKEAAEQFSVEADALGSLAIQALWETEVPSISEQKADLELADEGDGGYSEKSLNSENTIQPSGSSVEMADNTRGQASEERGGNEETSSPVDDEN
jgi:hypothetical protein